MTRAWSPEQVVPPALARELIAGQFPELGGLPVEPLGVGWDNTAYLVGGRLVFRFPRRAVAVELIGVEARVLPRIAPRLPLAVPLPRWLGRPDRGYPWPFSGYERLPGRAAGDAGLDAVRRQRAAPHLGRFLAALHGVDREGLDLPGDAIARADMTGRTAGMLERVEALAAAALVPDPDGLRRLVRELPAKPPPSAPRLCHGDLYARHLLVDGAGLPSGVIDWGDVHAGHPAVDLAIAHGFLPPEARPAFLEAYGPVDAGAWAFARLRALWYATVLMLYAHEVGDAPLLREAALTLGYARAEA